jgi:hypothetical protein
MRRELGLYGAANAPRKFDVWRHEKRFCGFVMQVKVTAQLRNLWLTFLRARFCIDIITARFYY